MSLYPTKFGQIEDALDGLISNFENIQPSAKNKDDWETLVDDLSHMRDVYPQLSDLFTQIQSITESSSSAGSMSDIQTTSDQVTQLQNKVEDINSDLSQTTDEISSLSKKLGITSCI